MNRKGHAPQQTAVQGQQVCVHVLQRQQKIQEQISRIKLGQEYCAYYTQEAKIIGDITTLQIVRLS